MALGFFRAGGALRSAGGETWKFGPPVAGKAEARTEFRRVFMPTAATISGQFSFTAGEDSSLGLDEVSLRRVPRPAGLSAPAAPWAGLERRTAAPLFKGLLTHEPGGYTVVSWSHDLNPQGRKKAQAAGPKDQGALEQDILAIFKETGEAGMGFMDLPGRLDEKESWRTVAFHREQFRKYGVRYDVFCEGSASTAAALENGAELLNPSARHLGARAAVSVVDPAYVEAQCGVLRRLGEQLRGEPFVGYWYGKDEPSIHLPEGEPSQWGKNGQAMAKAVREQYGFGHFDAPQPKDKSFLQDPNRPLRWIAYNRWANERFIASRCRLSQALHEADPEARYSPANYCFMGGFPTFDYSRLAACSDLMECDPYASSAERRPGRGVYNHGFGAKFMSDLTGKPVRIVAQAFDYAGYAMTPDDLREWVSQALRCGATAIDYYEMDRPRWTHPDRWRMMLHLASVITRMNCVDLPRHADTAVLYTLYTHMSHGPSTGGDEVYAAHALVGELAGSWFKFVSDAQLERGEASLNGYKAVYLPLAKFMTPAATQKIEDYVRAGGVLVCGDAEAFGFDLAGHDTSAVREWLLGFRTLQPSTSTPDADGVRPSSGAATGEAHGRIGTLGRRMDVAAPEDGRAPGAARQLILKSARWGLPAGATLPLFTGQARAQDSEPGGRAWEIEVTAPDIEIWGTYPDGSPALVAHKLGQGQVITFAANPFAPQVVLEPGRWPALFKGLQQSLGCQVDLPIWHFVLPSP